MKYYLLVFIIFAFMGCKNIIDPCAGYACFTPPPIFTFQMVDKETGEDLFLNGTLDSTRITFTKNYSEQVEFTSHRYDSAFFIESISMGWNAGKKGHYIIGLGDSTSVEFDLQIQEANQDCCTFFKISTFELKDYTLQTNSGLSDGYSIIEM